MLIFLNISRWLALLLKTELTASTLCFAPSLDGPFSSFRESTDPPADRVVLSKVEVDADIALVARSNWNKFVFNLCHFPQSFRSLDSTAHWDCKVLMASRNSLLKRDCIIKSKPHKASMMSTNVLKVIVSPFSMVSVS